MHSARHTPTFSISIEWENARFAELDRTRRMLRALRAQLGLLPTPPRPPQINLLYDRRIIDGAMVRKVVEEELQPPTLAAETRIIPNEGLRYYQQKNFGARQSDSDLELTIFLDCDVIPEPGWLQALIDSFQNPDVGVVAGETYVEYKTFYSKAFALFWFFLPRDASADLRPATFFHANNVAFRSELFAAYPFPELPTYRGQCMVLAHTLRANGIGLYVQKRARVSHPVPLTLSYFVARALNDGRDEVLVSAMVERPNRPRWRAVYWNFRKAIVGSFRKFRAHARDVELALPSAIGAYLVAVAYFSLKAIGELVTHVQPNLVSRLFRI